MKEIPEPQSYLTDHGKEIYYEICELLLKVGALEDVDSFGLSMMAQSLDLFQDASEQININGSVQTYKTGAQAISAHMTVAEKSIAAFFKFSEKFGLSNKDRERIMKFKKQPKQEDQIDKLLK